MLLFHFDDSIQIISANILPRDYSGLPLFTVIQCFHVTHLIVMLSKGELVIHIFDPLKGISSQVEMILGESSVASNEWFHSFYRCICTST